MLPDEVRKAVDAVRVALNDWTATYASEFCDESTVEAARKRISERGTLAYICDALSAIESIRARLLELEAENERLREDRDSQQRAAIAATERAERAEALLRSCNAACKRVIEQDGGILGGIDFNALGAAITAHLSENSRG